MNDEHMVFVGAEGMSEIESESWYHKATKEEIDLFCLQNVVTNLRRNETLCLDRENRPYWLIKLHDNAPDEAKYKAERYIRVKRLFD
jgi:hypothetical protein